MRRENSKIKDLTPFSPLLCFVPKGYFSKFTGGAIPFIDAKGLVGEK